MGRQRQLMIFLLCLAPAGILVFDLWFDRLSANPIDDITDRTGIWALRLLLTSLAVTPMRRLTGWANLAPLRRTLGLAAFSYAGLHFLTYLVLDQFFDWRSMAEDVVKRPYITAGLFSLALLTPLALTSRRSLMRRLGGVRWRRLHRSVYAAAAGAVIHYFWLVKADTARPLGYAAVLTALLLARIRVHTILRLKTAEGESQKRA